MSTIIVIDPPTMAARSTEDAETARLQLLEDAKTLQAAGFNVRVLEPSECKKSRD